MILNCFFKRFKVINVFFSFFGFVLVLIYSSLGNSLKRLDIIELFNFFIFNGISDVGKRFVRI